MNKVFLKMIISVFLFIGIIGVHMYGVFSQDDKGEDVVMGSTLPVVSIMFEEQKINTLCGYTMEMEEEYMRDHITPISEDNTISIVIDRYENSIVNISFEIRSIDGERLVQEHTLSYFETEGDQVRVSFELSNMLEDDTEYSFRIQLVTESHEMVNYYTRIIRESKPTIKKYIDYVKAFSASTFDKELFEEYKPSLERYGYNDDTNFGIVNNGSDTASLTWGDLKPAYASNPQVQVKEIVGDISCIQLKYMVVAKNEYGADQYYNVTEYFRVRQGNSMMYVYVYERKMEQLFESNNSNVTDKRINLGIDSDLQVEMSESPKGSYLTFVKERNLWCMDINENKMINIFSLDSGKAIDVRNKFDNSDIEIVSTSQDGEVLFLVYGYMNRGAHEGKVGVSLCKYSIKENSTTELVFVPSKNSYYVLRENIGKFAYITSDNLLYLMLEDSIYTITFDSNEYVQLVSGLHEGNFIISEDNTMVAWHENGNAYEATSIRVIDIENNVDYVIEAAEGEYVKVFGFVEHDLVYGTAKQSDVQSLKTDKILFPMYKINVRVNDGDREEEYKKDGVFITNVTIKDNVINMQRAKKDETGVLSVIEDDQFINKVVEKVDLSEQDIIATELKRKELVIKKAFQTTSENKLVTAMPKETVYTNPNTLTVQKDSSYVDNNYYMYAYGGLYLCTQNLSLAINEAQTHYGVVVDGKGQYMFARMSKTDSTSITGINELLEKGYESMEAVLADEEVQTTEIIEADSETIFYFTSKNKAIITYIQDIGLVVISGHSGYKTIINEVEFTNMWTRESFVMDYDEALELLNNYKRYIIVEK